MEGMIVTEDKNIVFLDYGSLKSAYDKVKKIPFVVVNEAGPVQAFATRTPDENGIRFDFGAINIALSADANPEQIEKFQSAIVIIHSTIECHGLMDLADDANKEFATVATVLEEDSKIIWVSGVYPHLLEGGKGTDDQHLENATIAEERAFAALDILLGEMSPLPQLKELERASVLRYNVD